MDWVWRIPIYSCKKRSRHADLYKETTFFLLIISTGCRSKAFLMKKLFRRRHENSVPLAQVKPVFLLYFFNQWTPVAILQSTLIALFRINLLQIRRIPLGDNVANTARSFFTVSKFVFAQLSITTARPHLENINGETTPLLRNIFHTPCEKRFFCVLRPRPREGQSYSNEDALPVSFVKLWNWLIYSKTS